MFLYWILLKQNVFKISGQSRKNPRNDPENGFNLIESQME